MTWKTKGQMEDLGSSGYWLESGATSCHVLFRRWCQWSKRVLLLEINNLQDLKSTSLLAFFSSESQNTENHLFLLSRPLAFSLEKHMITIFSCFQILKLFVTY